MLALKNWNKAPATPPPKEFLDLPDELLDLIVLHLYTDGGSFIRDIIPFSLICRRLRKAAAPILFHTVSIRVTWRYVDRRSFNILLNLDSAPFTFASQIRHIKQDDSYIFRAEDCEDLKLSNELVRGLAVQGIRNLVNVRSISVGCCKSALIHLMHKAFPEKPFNITIEGCFCSRWANSSTSLNALVGTCTTRSIPHQFNIAVDSDIPLCDLEPFLSKAPTHIRALSWASPAQILPSISAQFANLTNLEELHLREPKDHALPALDTILPHFKHLKRLSLLGSDLCQTALKTISQITTLESLRLNSTIDRIFHAHLHNHTFEGLPYLHLPNLTSLSIRYISRYLSIHHIVPQSPKLTHLRIEYHNRNERLTSYDLRWIATNAPNLHTLELNVGALANLWHPTAIAGVDVDIDVYSMLEALSSFPHLHTLRMFPSYWQSTAGYLHFVQPVTDDQAIRIFHHLKPRLPRLRLLLIANSFLDYRSRNEVFSRGLNGEPVRSAVRPLGCGLAQGGVSGGGGGDGGPTGRSGGYGKTLLSTHEAKKGWHMEQIWEGDRRLTMVTVRHHGVKLHFDEIDERWVLPAYELPFDERAACVSYEGSWGGV